PVKIAHTRIAPSTTNPPGSTCTRTPNRPSTMTRPTSSSPQSSIGRGYGVAAQVSGGHSPGARGAPADARAQPRVTGTSVTSGKPGTRTVTGVVAASSAGTRAYSGCHVAPIVFG